MNKNRLGAGLAIELSVNRLGTTHENHTQGTSDDTEATHYKRRQEVTYRTFAFKNIIRVKNRTVRLSLSFHVVYAAGDHTREDE